MKQDLILQDYLKDLEASKSCMTCKKVPLPELEKDTRYIFISYSRKDYKKVYADLAEMYVRGVPFFYDRKLTAGRNWENEIRKRMKDPRCAGVIFYISENFFLSEPIRKEISFAFKNADEDLQEKQLASFSVNLTEQFPSQIQKNAFDSMSRDMANEPFARPTWRKKLTRYFSDDITYVAFEEDEHLDRIIENIQVNFNIFPKYNLFDFGGAMFCSGKGELRFPSGAVYKGTFENGRFSGQGMLTYSGGAVYEGRWKNGEKDGRGKMLYPSGIIYDGQWKADEKCGKGVLTYPNGVTYEGSWKNDKKNGKCVYTHPDGTVYSGFWKNDKRHGKGMLKLPNGMVNEGQWENNQFTGLGTCTWPDGRKYQGQWLKNKRHGTGTMTWKDGSVYVGQWEKGMKHGIGTLKFSDGTVMSGRFENDKFIGPEE